MTRSNHGYYTFKFPNINRRQLPTFRRCWTVINLKCSSAGITAHHSLFLITPNFWTRANTHFKIYWVLIL